MGKRILIFIIIITLGMINLFGYIPSYIKEDILKLNGELKAKAMIIAQKSYEHFKGWDGRITEKEQKILFSSASFIASVDLFGKLVAESESFYTRDYLTTNIYNAFKYVADYFYQLKEDMYSLRISPYELREAEYILNDMEREFSSWRSSNNLAYLNGYYVKGSGDTVYLIRRVAVGQYEKRAFANLESIFAYTYFTRRKKNPWKFLKRISLKTLSTIPEGEKIEYTFEGKMIIEKAKRANRPVYLIKNGKKHALTSPAVVERYGGWKKVYEVPSGIISKYPTGEEIE
jgi:hypothetical protein